MTTYTPVAFFLCLDPVLLQLSRLEELQPGWLTANPSGEKTCGAGLPGVWPRVLAFDFNHWALEPIQFCFQAWETWPCSPLLVSEEVSPLATLNWLYQAPVFPPTSL